MSRRYFLALDLHDDPELIAEYERYHREVWPEILLSLRGSGIEDLEIYRTGNRLLMVMEVGEGFSFEAKAEADLANPRVQEWEELMWTFQKPLPWAEEGQKWVPMERIFTLAD